MNKADLRKEYIEKRKLISCKKEKSHMIFEKLTALPCLQAAKAIAVYCSLQSEADTEELISFLLKAGKEVYLPRVEGSDMNFYRISSLAELKEKGSFGICEPQADINNKLSKERLDVVIMPGVCFDKAGNRIGFGKGYYDRYLQNAPKAYKIAICFEEQIIDNAIIDSEEHDIKADIIVTDKEIYSSELALKC